MKYDIQWTHIKRSRTVLYTFMISLKPSIIVLSHLVGLNRETETSEKPFLKNFAYCVLQQAISVGEKGIFGRFDDVMV